MEENQQRSEQSRDVQLSAEIASQVVSEMVENKKGRTFLKKDRVADPEYTKHSFRQAFKSRVDLIANILKTLLRTDSVENVIVFLVNWFNRTPALLQELSGVCSQNCKIGPREMLEIHFQLGHSSYSMFDRVSRAVRDVSKKCIVFSSWRKCENIMILYRSTSW